VNKEQLQDFIINARLLIENGAVEDKIRHYFSSKLNSIFPDEPWWVKEHMLGTEQYVHYADGNKIKNGFVDAVVGKTVIEYEKNLTIQDIFNEGFIQVKEYSAALCNLGIPENEVLGVLSDTLHWYGYKIHLINKPINNKLLGPDDIELEQIAYIDLSPESEDEYKKFETFINTFVARNESRLLNSNTLSIDFGVESSFYNNNISIFSEIVHEAFEQNQDYANLIKQVWQNFIAFLGVSDYGKFSVETYVSEFYLVTVAKIICANILEGKAIISSSDEIKLILNGKYFTRLNIHNFIDYDYFGWLNEEPYVDLILHSALEIQNRLCAYDFSRIAEEDIFGKLLAQLANKEHRLMLGQEFTPHWIAKDIVNYNLEQLSEEPRIIDMCCGSGIFLIESIKAIRREYDITPSNYNENLDNIIFSAVTGFDIDPLAVMLAKVNWILTMRDLFAQHKGVIIVPIYHADSLFVPTPITQSKSHDDTNYYITLNEQKIRIPDFLFFYEYRKLFDIYISKIYSNAMVRASTPQEKVGEIPIDLIIEKIIQEASTKIDNNKINELKETAISMISQLEILQRQRKNGIWYFIISNSYRPGLTEQQFNCVISNPPWMAMSKLADNPYKDALKEIAKQYSIQPHGAAHPHMELATIFLVSSINRYLKENSPWSFVMPISLMSGLNHEAFRNEKYRISQKQLNTSVSSIWELPTDTFKNKAIVLSGVKNNNPHKTIQGRFYNNHNDFKNCIYTLNHQGKRTAWTNKGIEFLVSDIIGENPLSFIQGCDLFPRTVLYHDYIKQPNGTWNINKIDRNGNLWFLISESKKNLCNDLEASQIEDIFLYDSYISKHLSPFIMADTTKILMPGIKDNGIWKILTPEYLSLVNPSTAYVFNQIKEAVNQDLSTYLSQTINIYDKLYKQNFDQEQFLVLSSASGSNPCAAYIDLHNYNIDKLIIDQTLYWYMVKTEEEALFYTGLLNSEALALQIADFQPEGAFGKRHIHTLPYKIIPHYNESELHKEVVEKTRILINEWKNICVQEDYKKLLNPNSGNLNVRRKIQQRRIRTLDSYISYNAACENIFL
jgi:predicted RNA methylase